MIEDDVIFERIKEFVFSVRWKYKQALTRETRIYEELKIDGDDAVEFITAFGKTFDVNLSDFSMTRYFNGEGIDPIGIGQMVGMLFGHKEERVPDKNITITLGHLEKAIKAGRLDEEIING
jgi:acyl carrier protein